MKWIIALMLLAILAGCLDSDDVTDDEPPGTMDPGPGPGTDTSGVGGSGTNETPRPPATGLLWGGQVLEAIDCQSVAYIAVAPRDAVESRVPDHLTVPGNGPVVLSILMLDCQSMTVGNASFQKDAGFYLTYLAVNDGDPATDDAFTYLLEFGSDYSDAWQGLQERGVPAVGGTFQDEDLADTDGTTFATDASVYTFRDTGSNPTYDASGTYRTTLLAGSNAEIALRFQLHQAERANTPVPATLQLQGGVLEELFGPAAPGTSSEGRGGATFQDISSTG